MTDRPPISPECPQLREDAAGTAPQRPGSDTQGEPKPYARRKFRDWEVIACLVFQGVEVRCYRTQELITMDNVHLLQKEHLVELGLIEPEKRHMFDVPGYCRYSLAEAHAVITNGNGATSAGSSKHRIAKLKRLLRVKAGERSRKRKGPPLKSRPFPKGHRPMRRPT